jgi:hypothetical protein
MDSSYKNISDRIYRIVWIERPSAIGHLALRRRKKIPLIL